MFTIAPQYRRTHCKSIIIVFVFLSFLYAAQQAAPFKVLAFYTDYNSMGDGGHRSFAQEANTWFPTVAAENGFIYEKTTGFGDLNATKLANYKVILFLDNLPGNSSQRSALQAYMEGGGGWLGFHVCAFNMPPTSWDWYFKQFLAMGSFVSNTWPPSAPLLLVEDTTHPAMKGLGTTFVPAENEFYRWQNDLRTNPDIKVLASIDKSAYPVGTQGVFTWSGAGYVPIIWTNKNYKMVYTNIGHNRADDVGLSKTFTNANMAKFVLNTIKWLGGASTSIEENIPKSLTGKTPPNVSMNAYTLSISVKDAHAVTATLYNIHGQLISTSTGASGMCNFDRNDLLSGIYVMQVRYGQNIYKGKISLY